MIFFIIFSTVLSLLYSYTCWKLAWTSPTNYIYKILTTIIISILYFFLIANFIFQINNINNHFTNIIAWFGYAGLGSMSLLFFTQIIIDIVLIIKKNLVKKTNFDPKRKAFISMSLKGIVGAFGLFGTGWGIYNALKTPVIKKIKIPIKNLPEEFKKIKMAHITDLHVSNMITNKYVERVSKELKKMNPDILFFTGDAADGSVESFGNYMKSLNQIQPKYGKYFVTGNHEYYSDMNGWLRLIENLGFKILINESQNIIIDGKTLMITGIPDRTGKYFSKFHKTDMKKAINGMSNPDMKILLAHQPRDVEYAIKYNFQLQLSGHTHGGQYFPFSLLVALAHPFLKGLHKKKDTWVYINQGTGYWGPPMRIGTEPEITEITLTT